MTTGWHILAQIVLLSAAVVYGVPYLIGLWREDSPIEPSRNDK